MYTHTHRISSAWPFERKDHAGRKGILQGWGDKEAGHSDRHSSVSVPQNDQFLELQAEAGGADEARQGGRTDAVYLPPCSQERRRACKVVTSLMLVWGFRVVRVKCYTVPHLGQGRWPLGMCWVPPVNGRQLPPALTKCQWSRNSVGQSRPA